MNPKMPTVDVIVPCYNYGRHLTGCVQSVLAQPGVAVRVLIMDDASPDDTEAIGRGLAAADPRVLYFRHATNQGHIATYNEALAMLTADYCMILSADDVLTPGALQRATWLMETYPDVGFTYGPDIPFRDTPPAIEEIGHGTSRIIGYFDFLRAACQLGHTGMQSPTVLVRTSVHRAIGGYLPELPHAGDTEIWLRLALHARVGELDTPQAFRRLHAANMSLTFTPLDRLKEQVKAFDTHFVSHAPATAAVRALHREVRRTIAESAFWSGARAFDMGDHTACDGFLGFASDLSPEIESSAAWRRLSWKRWLGPSICRRFEPLAARVRAGARPAASRVM